MPGTVGEAAQIIVEEKYSAGEEIENQGLCVSFDHEIDIENFRGHVYDSSAARKARKGFV